MPAEQQPGLSGDLDAFIDRALEETGADRVELMGHSNGTINSRHYLLEGGTGAPIAEHASKVAHFVHLAGTKERRQRQMNLRNTRKYGRTAHGG